MDFLNLDGFEDSPQSPNSPRTSSNNNQNQNQNQSQRYNQNMYSSPTPDNDLYGNSFKQEANYDFNTLSGSYVDAQVPAGLTGSLSSSLPNNSFKDDQNSNIRASLSRALNSNSSTPFNYSIPEEPETGNQLSSTSNTSSGQGATPQSTATPTSTSGTVRARRNTNTNPILRPATTTAPGTTPNTKLSSSHSMSRKGSLITSSASPAAGSASPSGVVLGQPIDRKRRDNMNEKIQELLDLIPQGFFEDAKDKSSGTKDGKPNKGQILCKSVDYINWLQQQIDEKNRKEVELSIKLRNLEISKNVSVSKRMNLLHTSAEIGLSRIGVGPLAEEPEQTEQQQ